MPPEHARLAALLEDAAVKRGSATALANALGMNQKEVSRLINGKRFLTMRQALRIEEVLGVSARELLIEAATARIDEALAKARDGK
jgi:plasmid maintenance system antidote protein VapI